MRLIDADVFKTEYENLVTWVSHRAEKARLREFIKDIQDQPTVKAIPIEFIEKFKKEFRAVASVKWVLDWLLEKWGKENEAN